MAYVNPTPEFGPVHPVARALYAIGGGAVVAALIVFGLEAMSNSMDEAEQRSVALGAVIGLVIFGAGALVSALTRTEKHPNV